MSDAGYATPEEAALAGFESARVVRVRETDWNCIRESDGREVEIELAMNEPPTEYQYFVHVYPVGDRWYERLSHN